MIEHSLIDLQL